MKFYFQFFKILLLLCCLNTPLSWAENNGQQAPALLLANLYHTDISLQHYWVSEKYDGVRAYWNGANFVSRQGHVLHAPEWFTSALPKIALDGELWLGREKFEPLSGIVRRQSPATADWLDIKFMVFDLPGSAEIFEQRLLQLEKIISEINAPHIRLVPQFKVASHEALAELLDEMVAQGAEGLMLHRAPSVYNSGRSDDLLKLKKHLDAEAVVVRHIPGEGKYTGLLGSLEVVAADNRRFKIGSGFSDAERKNPPAIGATITYKYFGLTVNGLPRFASFMRVRSDY